MTDKSRIYSVIATFMVVLGVLLWMTHDTIRLNLSEKEWPPKHESDIVIDDEFAELLDLPMPKLVSDDPAKAYSEIKADKQAEAAPETGMETIDQGTPADAPEIVTQSKTSPVKTEKKEKPVKQGPSKEELRMREQEKISRKATNQTQNAFRNAGKNNTTNRGKTQGDAGRPDGSQSAVSGRGTGRVGGGWSMPGYANVPSTVTGSIELMVKIDRNGHVTSVSFIGGDAPAATDSRVRAACEREVRSRNFTRRDPDNAPDESTAYITYKFR